MSSKKERLKAKKKKTLERKIMQMYPFLKEKSRWENKFFPFILPNEDGWMKAFFYQMMDEIKANLIRTGCMDTFCNEQYKEKYGSMRYYVCGCERSTYDIISKYETLSTNICLECGRPDVGYTTSGWIYPICKCCYSKNKYNKRPYEEVINTDDMRMSDKYCYTQFTSEGQKKVEIDISKEAEKIRQRWKKKHAKLSSSYEL